MIFVFFFTFAAQAGKAQAAALDLATCFHGGGLGEFLGYRDAGQVDHRAAACADEVHMGVGVSVEPFHTFHGAKGLDQALVLEKGEVAIHRAERQIRNFRFQLSIHPIGGGMHLGFTQTGQDGVTLAKMLGFFLFFDFLFVAE